MQVEYITHYGNDLSPVNAARVSFANESDWEVVDERPEGYLEERLSIKDSKLIHYLAKNKHTSCFEHQGATLRLKVPIFIARQIQRHRTFSYNEISRRYVDTEPEFYWPDKWRKRAENVKQGSSDEVVGDDDWAYGLPSAISRYMSDAIYLYNDMLDSEVAPELARMILPQNMYTEFYMTGNLRSWAHFLKLRLDSHAQIEVQKVAGQVRDILQPLFPVSMEALLKYE